MIKIRVAQNNDHDYKAISSLYLQVHELHATARPDLFISGISEVFSRDDFEKILADADSDILVAELDAELVGFTSVSFFETKSGHGSALIGRSKIEAIVVDEQTRRKGVGLALIRASEDWALMRGADYMFLDVHCFNKAAQYSYEKAGYRTEALRLGKALSVGTVG